MNDDKKFYQHLEYLNNWKPALDAKAVNTKVTAELRSELSKKERVKILDCGTGTGRGLVKLLEEGLIGKADVEAFDIDSNLVADMPRLFQESAARNKWLYTPIRCDKKDDFIFEITSQNIDARIHGFRESVYELTRREKELRDTDLVTGQAFIEHVNQGIAYPILTMFLKKSGLVYFSMNCDGWFNYSPTDNRERDEKVVGLFNDRAMNNQEFKNNFGAIFGGEAFCGRNLPYRFKDYEIEVIAYGPSDWVVTPFQQSNEELEFVRYTSTYIRDTCSSPEAEEMRDRWGLKEHDVYQWHLEKMEAIGNKKIGFTCVQKDILGRKEK